MTTRSLFNYLLILKFFIKLNKLYMNFYIGEHFTRKAETNYSTPCDCPTSIFIPYQKYLSFIMISVSNENHTYFASDKTCTTIRTLHNISNGVFHKAQNTLQGSFFSKSIQFPCMHVRILQLLIVKQCHKLILSGQELILIHVFKINFYKSTTWSP